MVHARTFTNPRKDQSNCPLFGILPAEIRDKIFEYALRSYEDMSDAYPVNTTYRRPGYLAPWKADRDLLQTCQQVYAEAWWHPWASATHTFWLALEGRYPNHGGLTVHSMQATLNCLHAAHGEVNIAHVRVFGQEFNFVAELLEDILLMDHFSPLAFTITIRHHDWSSWKTDGPLCLSADCVNRCWFPNSLLEFRMELETVERKKAQVDHLAKGMCERWTAQKLDGTVMVAKEEDCETSTWRGSSLLGHLRWICDEVAPETAGYYVKTVVFKPDKHKTARDEAPFLDVPQDLQKREEAMRYLTSWDLAAAKVPAGTPAEEALRLVSSLPDDVDQDEDPSEDEMDDDSLEDEDGDEMHTAP